MLSEGALEFSSRPLEEERYSEQETDAMQRMPAESGRGRRPVE
jgi:hypothetical protein